MTKTQLTFGVVIVFLCVAAGAFFCNWIRHSAEAEKNSCYILDVEYDKVKKIMVRTDSLEEIVQTQHGELVDRKWHNLNLSSAKLFSGWQVDGNGEYSVAVEDRHEGRKLLRFSQQIQINDRHLKSHSHLLEPSGYIKDIQTTLEMEPYGKQTRVKTRVLLVYVRSVPKSKVETVDRIVNESAERMLSRNQEAVSGLIDRYKDKKFIVPIGKNKQ